MMSHIKMLRLRAYENKAMIFVKLYRSGNMSNLEECTIKAHNSPPEKNRSPKSARL